MPAKQQFNLNIELDFWADGLRREGNYSENEIGDLQIQLLNDMDRLLELNYPEEKAFSLAVRSVALIPHPRKGKEKERLFSKFKLREYRKLQKYHSFMFIGLVSYLLIAGLLNFISKGFLAFMAIGPIEPSSLPGYDFSFKALLILGILVYIKPFVQKVNKWVVHVYKQLNTTPFYFLFSGACFIALAYWLNIVMNITLGVFVPAEHMAAFGLNKSLFDMAFFSLIVCAYSALLISGTRKPY